MRRAAMWWAAVVMPVWIVLVLCTHWEPVMRDSWGHYLWQRNSGLSFDQLWEFAKGSYVHNNPRFGQVLTFLLFTPGPWHSIVTPLVELSLFYLLSALVLGRWPSPRRADDALLFATILAMTAVTLPLFGQMMFYRPFTGNYLYGLVLNLAFVMPYRFHAERASARGWWWIPIMGVLGAASGLCNEHTDPAVLGGAMFATVMFWRRGERRLPWALAGIAGMIAGSAALFYAPAQHIRYNGLATQQSMLGRIVERGAIGNARVIGMCGVYLLPLIVWVVLALLARRGRTPERPSRARSVSLLVAGATAAAILFTLLASPKQGARLYLGSVVLSCAAVAGWVVPQLVTRWSRAVAIALIAGALGFVGWNCVRTYHTLGTEFRARLTALEHAPHDSVLELPRYTVKHSRWSFGDDLELEDVRNRVAASFTLALIKMVPDQRATTAVPVPDEP